MGRKKKPRTATFTLVIRDQEGLARYTKFTGSCKSIDFNYQVDRAIVNGSMLSSFSTIKAPTTTITLTGDDVDTLVRR